MSNIIANVTNRQELRDLGFGNAIRLNGKAGYTFSTESQSDDMMMNIYTSTNVQASVHEDDGASPGVQPGPDWTKIWDTDTGVDGEATDEAIASDVRSIMAEVHTIGVGSNRVTNPGALTIIADNVNGVENQRSSNSADHPNQQGSPAVPQA
jgi:hypothetical protein